MERQTEKTSLYNNLELKSVGEILTEINQEDARVALAVREIIPAVETFVTELLLRMQQGGRLFYIGAGTSGRLGVVDASECPPTFGVPADMVIGIMAGGDSAIRKAVEFAEDDRNQAWKDLMAYQIDEQDTLVGIAASGTTPYVLGGLEEAQKHGILTAAITCNPGSPVGRAAGHPLEASVGPEYVTGSTRMKSGTAQKLILNMISTAAMIGLGRVKGNRMIDMQLSNDKLIERGTKMIMEQTTLSQQEARDRLLKYGSVRAALEK